MSEPNLKTAPRKSILVVDDDRITRVILERMLCEAGYEVFTAENGERALELLQQREINAFVLDIRMPGMSGIELCRRLRSLAPYKITPVLFVTVMEEQANIREAFDAGGDDYVVKPVEPMILKARLSGLMQKIELINQLARVRRNLNRYVSPRTQKMVETYSATGVLPPPDEHHLCILFSDIRGFTALSEEIEPSVLFPMLSEHLGKQVDLVYRHGGYIDKFGGDGVMAVFDGPGMELNSCLCALDILDGTRSNIAPNGHCRMPLGIGIHSGPALIGNIGKGEHLDYSVIGNTVNLAARLCGYAEPMSIIVSKAVRDTVCDDPRLCFSGEHPVDIRGMKKPITLYQLTRPMTAKTPPLPPPRLAVLPGNTTLR
jgi:Adenylate cyclase, family 3 (some proteins contain HAMP domain)